MTQTTTQTELPPDTLRRRFAKADRERLMRHAENLESQMRVLAAILQSRDDTSGGPTDTSMRVLAEARALARAKP